MHTLTHTHTFSLSLSRAHTLIHPQLLRAFKPSASDLAFAAEQLAEKEARAAAETEAALGGMPVSSLVLGDSVRNMCVDGVDF
jgi:hypothetical protein